MENEENKQPGKRNMFDKLDQLDSDMALAMELQQQERGFMHLMMSESESSEDIASVSSEESYDFDEDDELSNDEASYANLDELDEEEDDSEYQDMEEDDVDPDEMSYEELIELGDIVGTESKGLSANDIKTYLHPYSYKLQLNSKEGFDKCVICQFEYEEEEPVVALECKHAYHSECISTWLQINKVCPICNMQVSQPRPVSDRTT